MTDLEERIAYDGTCPGKEGGLRRIGEFSEFAGGVDIVADDDFPESFREEQRQEVSSGAGRHRTVQTRTTIPTKRP